MAWTVAAVKFLREKRELLVVHKSFLVMGITNSLNYSIYQII